MRTILFLFALLSCAFASGQYYYKDIIGTRESADMLRTYLKNKVSRVVLSSFNAANGLDSSFYVEQSYSPSERAFRTITSSYTTNESVLIAYLDNAGNVIRTIDSNEMVVTQTDYAYNAAGQLTSIVSRSADSAQTSVALEEHIWTWGADGKPSGMTRIKNRRDTSHVQFKKDQQSNIVEETETRKGVTSFPVYYYYNDVNQLTDIVRFSKRVNRLLPEYMFEYSEQNQVVQKITVPENSSEYLIWRYQYNSQGLKVREHIYNKQKKLTGKIEYKYSFGS
jgi:YD repeat-containing protein